jgi:acetylornithine deacetylase
MTASIADTLAILEALVGFDTTSRNSNLELIAWVESYLAGHGVTGERTYDPTGQKASVFATIGPKDQPGYVLSGHTDVVPVDGQEWRTNPFRLAVTDTRAYGRGAVDMKGFLACCLAAVPAMARAPLKRPVHHAATARRRRVRRGPAWGLHRRADRHGRGDRPQGQAQHPRHHTRL